MNLYEVYLPCNGKPMQVLRKINAILRAILENTPGKHGESCF